MTRTLPGSARWLMERKAPTAIPVNEAAVMNRARFNRLPRSVPAAKAPTPLCVAQTALAAITNAAIRAADGPSHAAAIRMNRNTENKRYDASVRKKTKEDATATPIMKADA